MYGNNVFFSLSSSELEFERDSRMLQLPELEPELRPDEDKDAALPVAVLSGGVMCESMRWDLRGTVGN